MWYFFNMNSQKICKLLAEKIIRIFENGLPLSSRVTNYINSTFSNPSIPELKNILFDHDNCETDSLYELIFFPDESIQVQLEDFLETHDFAESDQEKIKALILAENLRLFIIFQEEAIDLNSELSDSGISNFISHLKITKRPDQTLLHIIDTSVHAKLRSLIKVRLRNMRFTLCEKKVLFLSSFFQKIHVSDRDFNDMTDLLLQLVDAPENGQDIYQALCYKRDAYIQSFKAAEKFERVMRKSNMETLMLQGFKAPYIDKKEAVFNIRLIEKIIESNLDYSFT